LLFRVSFSAPALHSRIIFFFISPSSRESETLTYAHRKAAYPHTGLGARTVAFRDRWGKHSSPALRLYC